MIGLISFSFSDPYKLRQAYIYTREKTEEVYYKIAVFYSLQYVLCVLKFLADSTKNILLILCC